MINCFRDKNHFLCNFYPCPTPFIFRDKAWPTSEHAYQAMKTEIDSFQEKIRLCRSPNEAKKMGRSLKVIEHWDIIKVPLMYQILHAKFLDSRLRAMLLDTGDQELVEGNTWNDTYWGVCNGVGQNMLGKTLMIVRNDIRKIENWEDYTDTDEIITAIKVLELGATLNYVDRLISQA